MVERPGHLSFFWALPATEGFNFFPDSPYQDSLKKVHRLGPGLLEVGSS